MSTKKVFRLHEMFFFLSNVVCVSWLSVAPRSPPAMTLCDVDVSVGTYWRPSPPPRFDAQNGVFARMVFFMVWGSDARASIFASVLNTFARMVFFMAFSSRVSKVQYCLSKRLRRPSNWCLRQYQVPGTRAGTEQRSPNTNKCSDTPNKRSGHQITKNC